MTLEEARLRLALIALVGNGSSDFPSNEASTAITAAVGLDVSEFTTTRTFSGSFLIVCNFSVARNQILAASPISMAGTNLSMPPWTRFARATQVVLSQKVVIVMDDIPEHTWNIDTTSELLARHGRVERVDSLTSTKADMSTFRLKAWITDPSTISSIKLLCVPELDIPVINSDIVKKRIMQYPIYFNLHSITDFHTSTTSLKQDRDTHHAAVEQEAKDAAQLVAVLGEKEQGVTAKEKQQWEHTTLGDASSQVISSTL
jgi:hypothetical protein